MAFVHRAEKNLMQIPSSTSPLIGPGSYVQHLTYKLPKSYAPFNSKEERGGRPNKDKEALPGPGSYQIEQNDQLEKVIVSSANDEMKIIEIPKPQSNFKSQTKRFSDKGKNGGNQPGPGQYEAIEPFKLLAQKALLQSQQQYTPTIIEKLMKMNRYQSTPSIPSKVHTFGYTENENNELALNQLPNKQYTGTQKDSVGPGQYEYQEYFDNNQNKGTSWHKYKQARLFKMGSTNPDTVGPGSYDVQLRSLPLYKMKQSPGFASKSLRASEARKGVVASQFIKQGLKKHQMDRGEDSDSEEEFVEDSVPGPGHYHPDRDSSLRSSKTNSNGNFGSLSKRFPASSGIFSSQIGPGEYNPAFSGAIGKNSHDYKVRNPPFLSSDTRFLMKKIEDLKPGPGAYEPKLNLEDKLIGKIQKGYRGNFGSTERRFKNEQTLVDDQPGPGAYIENLAQPQENSEQQIAPSAVFKSASKRSAFFGMKDQKPPVGSYKLDYYDINKSVKNPLEMEDPDMRIKVPNLGFSTSEVRFKAVESNKRDEIEEDEHELSMIKEKKYEESKASKKNGNFLAKADRFNYKQKSQIPAPGQYYDANLNNWNKRTFNIHFADF